MQTLTHFSDYKSLEELKVFYHVNSGTRCSSNSATWCYRRVSVVFRVWLKGRGQYFLQSQPCPLSHFSKISCILNTPEHCLIPELFILFTWFYQFGLFNLINVKFAKLLCFDCNSFQHSYMYIQCACTNLLLCTCTCVHANVSNSSSSC